MNETNSILNSLLCNQPTLDELKHIEDSACKQACKPHLSAFVMHNKERILQIISQATSIDQQLNVLRILGKTLTKKQIAEARYFGELTAAYVGCNKSSKRNLREFLVKYNAKNNCVVAGCRVKRLHSKFKDITMQDAVMFLNNDCIKVFGTTDIIVIQYSSIMRIIQESSNAWLICASNDRNVEILLEESSCHKEVAKRMQKMMPSQFVIEDSMSVSVEAEERNENILDGNTEKIDRKIGEDLRVGDKGAGMRAGFGYNGAEEHCKSTGKPDACQRESRVSSANGGMPNLRQLEKNYGDMEETQGAAKLQQRKAIDMCGGESAHEELASVEKTSSGLKKVTFGMSKNTSHAILKERRNSISPRNSITRPPILHAFNKKPHDNNLEYSSESNSDDAPLHDPGSDTAEESSFGSSINEAKPFKRKPEIKKKVGKTNFVPRRLRAFKRKNALPTSIIISKIESLYKQRLSYNRLLFNKMNQDAMRFKDKMNGIAGCHINILRGSRVTGRRVQAWKSYRD